MTSARSILIAALGAITVAGSAAPVAAQPSGPGPRQPLLGRGVALLIPELRDTTPGRAFVMDGFDLDRNGRINLREADAANRAYLRNREGGRGFGPPLVAPGPVGPPRVEPGPVLRPGEWDRAGMRGYRFRQNRYGAVFNLDDVLFRTASAEVLPTMEARLRPLAGYLRANPRVQVRVDGFTDSVGSDVSNLQLSRDRSRSVADVLSRMGVARERLRLEGHGETSPVATNATDAGRRLNRRVEITLVGQRAESFR